ncbi:Zn-dependent oxidoreductase [Agromyces sp. Root81]|uniref:NAD(P)-dependent alcohol dehydrogenase n=1 Tax=Agromyces sp. Root81 TaxID=1736601 RepID=UPI0006FF7707|nr:NAD(P)-dependent alcohol dehydrogenase [Agromyces sp. Root81]KRC59191.1 Zn-dependent oxidoreductase [Agromyces sp. Root81]
MSTESRQPVASATRTTMRAASVERFGGPEVVHVAEVPRPEAGPGELLVRVRASTVSIADHRLRSRSVPRGLGLLVAPVIGVFRPRMPVLGMEASGVVESAGPGVTRFAPGDEVIVMRGARVGCHAEFVIVDADGDVAPKPANLSFEEAAAIVFGGHTAMRYLDGVTIRPGSRVLVNGASGAVGSAAVQLAAARGAHVTAVTSGRNAELVRSLGASEVVDYTREDFAAGGRSDDTRYDVIVECVGNAPFGRVAHLLRPGGALLLVIADLPGMLAAGMQARRSGFVVDHRGGPMGHEGMARLAAHAESGVLRPVIDRTFDLDEIVEAHRYVDTGRKRGSVVLRIG